MEKNKQFCLFLISPEANAKEKDQLKKEKKVIYAKHLWCGGILASLLASIKDQTFSTYVTMLG